ncbi:hypothetical protein CSKR_104705 [Clonorchis sinensis]|uniref:Uncharacterized protein n=1 Tax=Clonorchis sinensis TaxID=79923 RepID=A0A3R7FUY6_CLOSI|nr:hypothetical protein CSKR_104705 [Clonorchis sinensis]
MHIKRERAIENEMEIAQCLRRKLTGRKNGGTLNLIQYLYIRNALLIRLLKILRQPTTGFALLGAHQVGAVPEFPKSIWFCERLTRNPAESTFFDVSRQLNVLHQAASCSSCLET